ncbi:hypothetical protein IWQ55_001171 [Labrenzia sp. EL_208]|uniref:Uncharacterized protein n=1 Tax=Roseibium album TaxID=311410 RepID=A0A0M7ANV9_9HYPH|nr:hypothetical protein [Labrenzia sp. EL_142]MBG6156720.1 hypothetical protein [Labrenzia sp. EL_162]MBG6163668.1 hypothetical protein [Labrenzia sp. EL_195]MBG6173257.1 hypothetical protein [Labrenzia sp. EL_132]MBG6195340.1 hypothetical protein [Labrenzia sp. EL_159]MBG6203030.1 hypothetical protein [Labrenzia sp. EL_13]MBG6211941.1 hypothetical protein [Labrenzia sp. EL_126]MBG6227973.1 hypothetical protein [Labrenzia sp. EL_208]CTQ59804.1 hypothetical protein LA5094_02573 [Roseibium al
MCFFGGSKQPDPEPTPPPPRQPDPQRQAKNLQETNRRRRAAAYGTRATTHTSPLGVSDFGSASRSSVTLLGRA